MEPTTNSVAYHSAMRRPNALRTEHVTHAADRVNELLFEWAIDLLAQPADQHVDDVGLGIEVLLPDMREDHRLRHDAACVAHQVFEERKLARPELDGRSSARDFS